MSRFKISITKSEYFPEGNYMKERCVFQQEFDDEEAIKRIAIAINSSTMTDDQIITAYRDIVARSSV